MKQIREMLLPLKSEHVDELIKLLQDTIESNQPLFQDEVEKLGIDRPLASFFLLAHTDTGFIYPTFDPKSSFSDSLKDLLLSCYTTAHNYLARSKELN